MSEFFSKNPSILIAIELSQDFGSASAEYCRHDVIGIHHIPRNLIHRMPPIFFTASSVFYELRVGDYRVIEET